MVVQFAPMQTQDPLTGLPLRPAFDEAVQAAVAKAQTQNVSVSVAVLDVDLFGQLNGAQGRDAADDTLAGLAEHLTATLTEGSGQVYRIGGDGFGVLMAGVDKEQAFLAVEAFRQALAEQGGGLTVSVGVASFPDDAARANEVFNKACEALYRAKVSGRNKTCLAREEKMVTKTSHYTQGQLLGLRRLAEREGIGEAVLLRDALNDLLRKHNA